MDNIPHYIHSNWQVEYNLKMLASCQHILSLMPTSRGYPTLHAFKFAASRILSQSQDADYRELAHYVYNEGKGDDRKAITVTFETSFPLGIYWSQINWVLLEAYHEPDISPIKLV